MPERNEKTTAPKPPALDPNLQKSIAAFRKENTPQNLNVILNALVKAPLLAPAQFDTHGAAPKPAPTGAYSCRRTPK